MSAIDPAPSSPITELSCWLQSVLSNAELVQRIDNCAAETLVVNQLQLTALSGDAGMRCYFRISSLPSCLAVYSPPSSEKNQLFVDIAQFLRQQGVRAPTIYAADIERGYLLIENLGERLLLAELNADSVESLYGAALLNLLAMQQSNVPPTLLTAYDQEKLVAEMQLFPEWFVTQLLDYKMDSQEKTMLADVFQTLVDSAVEQPQCFVHRDYHSRNLIVGEVGPPGVIDFQDAVVGPITYDVVSLLKDCYVRWPSADVERWLLVYANMAVEMGLLPPVAKEKFVQWFDWMGLQRHIKVLGIFARLFLRDNKASYLHDLPLVMRYTLEVADKYPQFKLFSDWFKTKLLPLAQQQSWYTDYERAGE